MFEIRSAGREDIESIVVVHLEMFPGFLMSLLGAGFLRGYYKAILDCPSGLLFVARDGLGDVVGFVSGFASAREFYSFFRKRRFRLALSALGHLLFRPALWRRVIENVSIVNRVADTAGVVAGGGAELSSIAVVSGVEGKGCGRLLVERFVARCSQLGRSSVVLTTDANGNERVNEFYRKMGFAKVSTVRRAGGRLMNTYRIAILGVE